MARLNDLRKLAGTAASKGAEGLDAAESVARRAGLTKRNGDISKAKVVRKVVLRPGKTARDVLEATAAEVRDRRAGGERDAK